MIGAEYLRYNIVLQEKMNYDKKSEDRGIQKSRPDREHSLAERIMMTECCHRLVFAIRIQYNKISLQSDK